MMLRLSTFSFVLALVIAACGGGGGAPAASDVTVELKDFQVSVSKTSLSPGKVNVSVKNTGSSAHNLTIIKTDLAPDKLPLQENQVKEDGKVAKTSDVNPGSSATLSADLAAGSYVFICNVPGHYSLGMRSQVTVR